MLLWHKKTIPPLFPLPMRFLPPPLFFVMLGVSVRPPPPLLLPLVIMMPLCRVVAPAPGVMGQHRASS